MKEWRVFFPVVGLKSSKNFETFGNVSFVDASPETLQTLAEQIDLINQETLHSDEEKARFREIFTEQVRRLFSGGAIGKVEVSAVEKHAALSLARNAILDVIDILNFFSMTIYPRDLRVHVFLPNEARGNRSEVMYFAGDDSFAFDFSNEAALQMLDLPSLSAEDAERIGMTRIREILAKPNKTEIERTFLAASRMAGKANVASRREDAFLLYAIAVESVIVGGDEKTDITYKLSTRGAHLLGNSLESRIAIKDDLKRLYGIRSGIVHRGQTGFPDDELLLMRRYCFRALKSMFTNSEVQKMSKKTDLSAWFDCKMLS